MKKFLSLLLTIVMILSLATFSFAGVPYVITDETTVAVTSTPNGKTYYGLTPLKFVTTGYVGNIKSIVVDNWELTPDYFTIEGPEFATITLETEMFEEISAGTHSVTFTFENDTDVSVTTPFKVSKAAKNILK